MVLKTKEKAPAFTLQNQDNKDVSLKDLKGKWVVLYFYPKDNTPGCSIEAQDFTTLYKDFQQLSCEVYGISPDSTDSHCKFIEKKELSIPLLSDPGKKMLEAYGVWGKKKFMGREYMGVLRTTYIIDPKGKVAHVWENVKVKDHAQDVLKILNELQ